MRKDALHISGLADTQAAPFIARELEARGGQCLLVTASAAKAKEMARTLSFFSDVPTHVLHEEEPFFIQFEAKSHGQLEARLAALAALCGGGPCVVVAPLSAALKKLPPPEAFRGKRLTLRRGEERSMDAVKAALAAMGYERAAMAESRGQFSVRGGILDVFAIDRALPFRIDFFGSEIDSVKTFDPESQRAEESLDEADIWPAEHITLDEAAFAKAAFLLGAAFDKHIRRADGELAEALKARKKQLLEYIDSAVNLQFLEHYLEYFYDETAHVWDYMADGAVMLDDPDRLREIARWRDKEAAEDFKALLEKGRVLPEDLDGLLGEKDFDALLSRRPLYVFTPFNTRPEGLARCDCLHVAAKSPPPFAGRLDFLETELRRYAERGYSIVISFSNEDKLESMREFLDRAGLLGRASLRLGDLARGMEFPEEKALYLRGEDVFASPMRRKSRTSARKGSPIKSFSDVAKGDYVVHEAHGIGKFIGVEQMDVQGVVRDYLKIKYAGEDVLYIPVEQMSLVQKYIGGEGEPKVSRLTGGEWKKAKAKAKMDIAGMAHELLALSAARKSREGYAFAPDTVWQKEFEDKFPYTETQDQLRAAAAIKQAMEQPTPMDRLLCGDVGYGKTEVAARAVFKCAAEGRQAAVLAPTTILASQHYHTFKERFRDFPFEVEMLSRFRTPKQQEEIVERLGRGAVDVIVGTHRLLSKDVAFKDLGLLVVDEEQRFGVKDKEAIKALRRDVDVLAMSATPIPRTLHMSLSGIRDMDLIEEPPEDRYPVQTYVMEQTDETLRETIRRELERDGQVYAVYNRVSGIHRVAAEIQALAPGARVVVGHGQMGEGALEDVMADFIEGRYNVLVCTTIIESGIDIPNVNTILIMDADRFGLSQLYQLRGRVGRSNRIAYAYLLYRRDKTLSPEAEKRLKAIREFTEFGAGFKIAMRDMEIRGAGNLLGVEQSGHMMSIGYELYCKLVDEAVRALSGEVVNPALDEVSFEIPVNAYIPESYIEDEGLKLQMYKRIALIDSAEDEMDVLDELIDRFGEAPEAALNLVRVARIRSQARRLGIVRLREAQGRFFFEFRPGAGDGAAGPEGLGERVARAAARHKGDMLVHGGAKPFIR
ncbi:MAG: transcription-repair coupling factor, partial [Clostridiales Family XIII bacterium]|nr:transcription-repair coupling factor [Clostridiales Family XIII bacterium]